MSKSSQSSPTSANTAAQGKLQILHQFDYASLEADIALQVQKAVHRIRQTVKRTLEDLIVVGKDLLEVKAALPHGQFGHWLHAEFGWTERTARNFMTVALRFGPKTEMISDLHIAPTAAYLLAAPSASHEAFEEALQRAEDGERITISVARELLDNRKKNSNGQKRESETNLPTGKLLGQLLESLEFFRQRWNPRQVSVLARQLREFADSLEVKQQRG